MYVISAEFVHSCTLKCGRDDLLAVIKQCLIYFFALSDKFNRYDWYVSNTLFESLIEI